MAEEETFKVRDRRRRDDDDAPASPPPQEAVRPPEPVASAPRREPEGSRIVGGPAAAQEGPDLRGLFIMLASSALVHLGEAADPATGERVFDLEQAKEAIDLLGLLRIKTEGNRTDLESHLLEEMLYDLQMRFVNAARSATGR
ncbi:MAG TPA: DUF1844 domain-containing protein [Candidatus Bathyarchaeia archaeon]|nr:DUF1844 domain-containing protein [Candidatus Bathyarchaeia archaeon]